MELMIWIVIGTSILMFSEGAILTFLVCLASRPKKWLVPFLVLLWPIAVPFLAYRAYQAILPIITQIQQLQKLQTNPLMGEMMNVEEKVKGQAGQ